MASNNREINYYNNNNNNNNNSNRIVNTHINNNNSGKNDKNDINNIINQQFHAAVAKNNIDKMKEWLKNGAKVDVWNKNDQTATHLALLNENYEMLKVLIEDYGADVNAKNNSNGINLITLACILDNVKILKLLIDNGANAECVDSEKQTPLHHCVQFDSQGACKYLLDAGVNVNVKGGPNRDTSLHYACFESNLDMIKLLCSRHDINLNTRNSLGQTAFYVVCTIPENLNIFNFLIEHRRRDGVVVNINLKDSKKISPIVAACTHKNYNIFKILLTRSNIIIDVSNPIIQNYINNAMGPRIRL